LYLVLAHFHSLKKTAGLQNQHTVGCLYP